MLLEVTCDGYQPLLVWIHNDNYNQRVPKPLVLVKAIRKSRTNTRRVEVLIPMISLVDLLGVLRVVRVMDMTTLHLSKRENCLLMSKRNKILG